MLSFVPRNDNGCLQNHSTVLSDKSGMKKLKNLLANRSNYVDNSLITALQICSDKPPVTFIEHCTSLNNSYKKCNYTTVAIVIRGVLDYIPTIFDFGVQQFLEDHCRESFCPSRAGITQSLPRPFSEKHLLYCVLGDSHGSQHEPKSHCLEQCRLSQSAEPSRVSSFSRTMKGGKND